MAEFHVAMGLIYRRLNGNPIPSSLPPEMTPPSARDLDNSVDFLKDLLKKDTNVRSTTADSFGSGSSPNQSRAPSRTFHGGPNSARSGKDATTYRHDDSDSGSERLYQSRSRHIDRRNVRYSGQDRTGADLDQVKRDLDKTDSLLESSRRREEDDEALDGELADLQYRIKRVQEDIEHLSRGPGGARRDDQRRKLERELVELKYTELPDLEGRIEVREKEKRREAQRGARERDARNRRAKFADDEEDEDEDDRYGGGGRGGGGGGGRGGRRRNDSPERGYLRGSYDRETPSRGSYRERDRDRDTPPRGGSYRERDRDDRDRDGFGARSPPPPPPPPPPAAATETKAAPPPPPPPPSAPATNKTMTAEERKAFIQSEAQRRLQERMRSLGLAAPSTSSSSSPSSPTTGPEPDVVARLEKEKQEAAERASRAEQDAEEREKQRQIRLEEERLRKIKAEEELNSKAGKAIETVKKEVGQNVANSKKTPNVEAHAAMRDEISKEETELRAREEALAAEKAKRLERLKKLEEEEKEAQRLEEDFQRKKSMFGSSRGPSGGATTPKKAAPPPPASRARPPPPGAPSSRSVSQTQTPVPHAPTPPPFTKAQSPPPAPVPPPPPPAPPAPPAPVQSREIASPPPAPPAAPAPAPPSAGAPKNTNPFHRLGVSPGSGSGATTPSTTATTLSPSNPFFRAQSNNGPAAPTPPPAPPAPVAAAAAPKAFRPPSRDDSEDEWDAPKEKDSDDDSSDDEGATAGRKARNQLANALFGNIMPSRSDSSGPASPHNGAVPKVPKVVPADGPVDRGALLGQIAGGARLKKVQTNDRSAAPVSGRVIGDASAPVQEYVPPPAPPSPPLERSPPRPETDKRQSIDWYSGMAADGIGATPHTPSLSSHAEEPDSPTSPPVQFTEPDTVEPAIAHHDDPMADFDTTTSKLRSCSSHGCPPR